MNNQYKTTSISLAAALQVISTSKLTLIDFSESPTRAQFVFDTSNDPSLEEKVTQFWARELFIDAFSYFEALKYLKSRLYEERSQ